MRILMLLCAVTMLNANEKKDWVEKEARAYAASVSTFGIDLYRHLDSDENIVFSPFSITSCLSMVYTGARGFTATQMHDILRFTLPQKDIPGAFDSLNDSLSHGQSSEKDHQLLIANGVWVDSSTQILYEYEDVLKKEFDAEIRQANFHSNPTEEVKKINSWISSKTKDKIEDLLSPQDITTDTRMLLANAVYFKGSWKSPFHPKENQNLPFRLPSGGTRDVEMMNQTASFPFYENSSFQLLSIPFTKDNENPNTILCGFLLPRSFHQLEALYEHLTEENLSNWISYSKNEKVQVTIPKFSVDHKVELNDPLQGMGMVNPFSFKANFSGIDGHLDLFLSKVVHQAYFDLNENGVTATAATAAIINFKAVFDPSPPKVFKADRPFIFFIYDEQNKTLLFLGRLMKPKQVSNKR